jgi:hypothetical protein
MSKTWKLMKLAFEYFSLGFQRIIFMIWGAQIAFLVCYLFWCQILYSVTIPALPAGYTSGAETLSGAMVIAGVAAIIITIKVMLFLAVIGMVVGYIRHYLAVLSYYDEQKYAHYIKYRAGKTPAWLMNFGIGQESERERLVAVEDCRKRCKAIKEGME